MLNSTIMFMTILFSSMMVIMSNSWILVWIMLEMNTMTFCGLMKTFSAEKKMISDWMMKYFIIQSFSSAILIFSMNQQKLNMSISFTLIMMAVMALMVKSAAAPFHQWFVSMTKNSNWKNALLLMTWQKLSPLYLMIFMTKKIIFFYMFLSMFIGSILQLNKKNFMEILALSSVFNLSWMFLAIMMNTKIFMIFTILYWLTVMMMMKTLEMENFKMLDSNQPSTFKKWIYLLVILNLAGIPPLINFVIKIMLMNEITKLSMLLMLTTLLSISSINLYIYMRIFNFSLISNTQNTQKNSNKKFSSNLKIMIVLSILPILLLF